MQERAVSHVHLAAHNIALKFAIEQAIRMLGADEKAAPLVVVLRTALNWEPPVFSPTAAATHTGRLAAPPVLP